MPVRRHKRDTATFQELSRADKARSISATVLHLERAILARARHAIDGERVISGSVRQVERMLTRLRRHR